VKYHIISVEPFFQTGTFYCVTFLFIGLFCVFVTECEEASLWVDRGLCCWSEVDCTQLYYLQWQYVISLL